VSESKLNFLKSRGQIRRFVLIVLICALIALSWRKILELTPFGRRTSAATAAGQKTPVSAEMRKDSNKEGAPSREQVAGEEFSGVLTYHNDSSRIGGNIHEKLLTTSNVNPVDFGKLFNVPVDGDVYAQPLFVPNVNLGTLGTHNVVYVATQNNSIYAIDGEDPKGTILWKANLGPALRSADLPDGLCTVIVPLVGVTGTPAIDELTKTLYVVARTFENSRHEFKLHALDIESGKERPGSPVVISAQIDGRGDGNQNGKISFDPTLQLQRAGLALSDDKVYIEFGSSCDLGNFHGWVMAYDRATLKQTGVFVTTPNGAHGGVWQSGAAPGIDSDGNLYLVTGDGTFDAGSGGSNYGDSFIKLRLNGEEKGRVLDYFTPFDQERLDKLDEDLGSSGAVLLPNQPGEHTHLIVSASKSGTIYVVDRDKMGHLGANDAQIVQVLRGAQPKIDSTAAYWEGLAGRWVYINGVGGPLKQYSVSQGKLSAEPTSQSDELFGYPGSTPSISADGKSNGIVWVVGTAAPDTRTVVGAYFHRIKSSITEIFHDPSMFFRKVVIRVKLLFHSPSIFWASLKKLLPRKAPDVSGHPAILRAYDANDVSIVLYDSTEAPQNRDQADLPVKFVVPTIANGRVYFGARGHLDVYGLLKK
jgi:hypothetical protein